MTEQATNSTADEQQPQFSLQHIYLRDLSLKSPRSPEISRQEWNPSISLGLSAHQKQLDGDFYEMVLTVSVTVENGEDTTVFTAEIQQADIFLIRNLDLSSMNHTLGASCPNTFFPYAREALDNLAVRGSFPALILSPVNFDALYAQEIARMQVSDEISTPPVQ